VTSDTANLSVSIADLAHPGRELTSLRLDSLALGTALSPDGRLLATIGWDSTVSVYDVASGRRIADLTDLVEAAAGNDFGLLLPAGLAFSPDGRQLAAANWTGAALVWDTGTWRGQGRLADSKLDLNNGAVPAFSPDGRLVAAFTRRGVIGLFATPGLELVAEIPLREQGAVYDLSFSPDGARLAAVIEGHVAVYDVATRRRVGGSFPVTLGDGVTFAGHAPTLAVPHGDRIVLWNLDTRHWTEAACTAAGRNLTPDEWRSLGPRDLDYRATCSRYPAPPHLPKPATHTTRPVASAGVGSVGQGSAREDAAVAVALESAALPRRFPSRLHPVGTTALACPDVDAALVAASRTVTLRGATAHTYSGPVITVGVVEDSVDGRGAAGVADRVTTCPDALAAVPVAAAYSGERQGVGVTQWADPVTGYFTTVAVVPAGARVALVRWVGLGGAPTQRELDQLIDGVGAAVAPG
jgi:WD40 repeat protein